MKAKVFFDKMKQEIPNETKYDTIGAVSGCCTFVHLMCLHFNVIFDVWSLSIIKTQNKNEEL